MSLIWNNFASRHSLSVCVFRLLGKGKQPESKPHRAVVATAAKQHEWAKYLFAMAFVWLHEWVCACVYVMAQFALQFVCLLFLNLRDRARGHRMGLEQPFTVCIWVYWACVPGDTCACVGSSKPLSCFRGCWERFRPPSPSPRLKRAEAALGSAWVTSNNELQSLKSRP